MKRLVDLHQERAALLMLAQDTQRLYLLTIQRFADYLGRGDPAASDLSDQSLCGFASWRLANNVSRGTIAPEQSKLLALWRFACQRGYRDIWPTVKPIRVPNRVPVAWLESDLKKLFAACSAMKPVGNVDGSVWWTALLRVIWDSGERITATLDLEWSGVSLEHRAIVIPAESRKGQTTDRLYKISERTAEVLDKLPRNRKPFYHPYRMETIYNRYKRLLERAELPTDRRSKFHRIRRSTASHYAKAGGDAQKLLGHSSAKVTQGYLDPRIVPSHPHAVDLLPEV